MARKKSILLVDANQDESRALFAALVRAGHSVTDTHRVDYALELLADRSFEVAVVDLVPSGAGNDDLLHTLAEDWSHPLIIGIADFAGLVAQGAVVRRGPHHFMGKPVDVQRLVQRISDEKTGPSESKGADILDYLRCLIDTGTRAVLEISAVQGHTCTLVVAGGTLIHAECGDTQGEQALYEALGLEGGSFVHVPWKEPAHVTIHQCTESLLCQTCEQGTASGEETEIL